MIDKEKGPTFDMRHPRFHTSFEELNRLEKDGCMMVVKQLEQEELENVKKLGGEGEDKDKDRDKNKDRDRDKKSKPKEVKIKKSQIIIGGS